MTASVAGSRQVERCTLPGGKPETSIAELYAEILRLDPAAVSSTASFFELGGTSLDVINLKRMLEHRFGHLSIPIATIVQNPTVRALAVSCIPALESRDYDPIVPLQVKGKRLPLFCVHAETGEVLGFLRLTSLFAGDRPCYALRARGFSQTEQCFATFDEMIATYTDAVRWCRPHGPYALVGYSYGGSVAFEIAKRLELQGECVAFVGSIDMPPYLKYPSDLEYAAVKLAFLLSLIDRKQAEELPNEFHSVCPGVDPCSYLMQIARPERVAKLDLDLEKFKVWAAVTHSLLTARSSYVPTGTVESMTVFYAHPSRGTKQEWLNNQISQWDEFTRMPNRYVDVPGEHYTLLGARHVNKFHAALRSELDRALRGR